MSLEMHIKKLVADFYINTGKTPYGLLMNIQDYMELCLAFARMGLPDGYRGTVVPRSIEEYNGLKIFKTSDETEIRLVF